MGPAVSDEQLRAFLDETLPVSDAAALEARLRTEPALLERLAHLRALDDAGVHSLGAIWRRGRLSCPTREQLGQWLLGVLDNQPADYIRFHLQRIGCRYCQANIEDLQRQAAVADQAQQTQRRARYFQTSVGQFPRRR